MTLSHQEKLFKLKQKEDLLLMEMANLRPVSTGLPVYIWAGPPPPQHSYRIKVMNEPGRFDNDDNFSVSIEDDPKIVAGVCELSASDLKKVFELVKKNKDLFIQHAQKKIDDDELKEKITKV